MSSKRARSLCRAAAWRFSVPTTAAFAIGTALAFLSVYLVVASGVRARSDAWLLGESDLLAEVVNSTPEGESREKLVREVAELAEHEVLPASGASHSGELPVFFLITDAAGSPDLWVGPEERASFLEVLRGLQFDTQEPQSIEVAGWDQPFRVVVQPGPEGGHVFLGLLDQGAIALLDRVARTFVLVWAAMVVFGFVISCLNAGRILGRVEEITNTAATIGSLDLARRVPGGGEKDEIAKLAATFNDMLDRIEASVQQIRSVTDSVAHDLRSPMTSIRGNLELALTAESEERLREASAGAIERLDDLLRSISTSLDVAEAEAGALRLDRRESDVAEMARDMVAFFRPAADERGVTLVATGTSPCVAWVDLDLARRSLANLLDNTMDHVPPGSSVIVQTGVLPHGVTLSVADDGPGFSPELADHAFERFMKGPNSNGHGIGLALVRAVARAHGGEARLESGAGRGATITLTFPNGAAQSASA